MNIESLLSSIKTHVGRVTKKRLALSIEAESAKVNQKTISLLYHLLNAFEDLYFITIANIPCCLMPDAKEHLVYKKIAGQKYFHDAICARCALKKTCPGWHALLSIQRNSVPPVVVLPREVVIEVTTHCNLLCQTCTLSGDTPRDASVKSITKILDECYSLGIAAVRFTGGEPLFHQNIRHILEYAKHKGFYVLLNTNATYLPRRILEVLEKKVDNVLVSLQGYDSRSDAYLTSREESFDTKVANIVRLKARVPLLRAGTVISKTLLTNFTRYVRLLRKLAVDNWELYRPIITEPSHEFSISKKEIVKVMHILFGLKRKGMKVKIANPVPFCIQPDEYISNATLLGGLADDGHSRIVWDARGFFKPSYFINKKIGMTVQRAWNNTFLQKMQTLAYLPQQCRRCKYLTWCRGGSRAVARNCSGNYFAQDPFFIKGRSFR